MMRYSPSPCCSRSLSAYPMSKQQQHGLFLSAHMSSSARQSSSSSHTSTSSSSTPNCSQPLGTPLPYDEHACSVSLPTWASVVGYEEGDPAVTSSMKCGYPRFVYHPYVLQLMTATVDRHGNNKNENDDAAAGRATEDCLVLPSEQAAHRCCAFLIKALYGTTRSTPTADNALHHQESTNTHNIIRVVQVSSQVYAVLFPAETAAGVEAKAYWQHTGEVVSSRRAEEALKELGLPVTPQVTNPYTVHHGSALETSAAAAAAAAAGESSVSEPHEALRQRIAGWAKVESANHVFLTPSGMSAIYHALRASRRYQLEQHGSPAAESDDRRRLSGNKGGTAIVYGFPYLDTLKMASRAELVPGGVEFFGRGNDQDLANLETMLQKGSHRNYCALLSEVPSNPLLNCPDLYRLRELADEYNFMLILDDTIANFLNVDLLTTGLADAVCTSLTKLASGRGDAMAGSIVANPWTEKGRWMQQDLATHHMHTDLFAPDAAAVLLNSADFPERNAVINDNAEGLADWLNEHEDVKTVYYPKHVSSLYKNVQSGGYGGLFSMILHSHMCQRTFYDALDVAKGPSLGTDFTLVCPYTLLAHYHELDFAMSYDVPPNLVRVAVGLEPLEEMKAKFANALRRSKLHPKVCMESIEQRRAFSTTARHDSGERILAPSSLGRSAWIRRRVQSALRTASYFVR